MRRGQLLTALALCAPAGSEYDEEEVDYEESDSDESWTTESAISSEAILSSMCMNGGEEKPFACPVPGCKKRYKVKTRRNGKVPRHLAQLRGCGQGPRQVAAPPVLTGHVALTETHAQAWAATGQGGPWFPGGWWGFPFWPMWSCRSEEIVL